MGLLSSGTATVPSLTSGIVPINDRPVQLIDVIPRETLTDTDSYAYLREETREHKAKETAKSGLKPTSVYKVKKYEATAKTIAHVSEPIARQDLEDAKLLGEYIDISMRQGVLLRLYEAILAGKGEGEELTGVSKQSGIQTQAFSENRLVSSRKAVTKLEEKNIPGGVFVMPLAQWEKFETLATTEGALILDGPVNRSEQKLWGLPVVTTSVLTGKTGFLVDFAGSTKLYERLGIRIDWSEAPVGSEAGKAAFLTNEIIFRGEGRFGFAVTRPTGIVEVGLEA